MMEPHKPFKGLSSPVRAHLQRDGPELYVLPIHLVCRAFVVVFDVLAHVRKPMLHLSRCSIAEGGVSLGGTYGRKQNLKDLPINNQRNNYSPHWGRISGDIVVDSPKQVQLGTFGRRVAHCLDCLGTPLQISPPSSPHHPVIWGLMRCTCTPKFVRPSRRHRFAIGIAEETVRCSGAFERLWGWGCGFGGSATNMKAREIVVRFVRAYTGDVREVTVCWRGRGVHGIILGIIRSALLYASDISQDVEAFSLATIGHAC